MKLLKFYGEWCGPCKTQNSIIKNLGNRVTIPIEEIDIDEKFDLVKSYKVTSVPTMILIDENGEVKRHTGVLKEQQFLEFIQNAS
jgi:thioredoxin 1